MTAIAFRVDASAEIGTGHLMRCLTLADALRARGASTRFLCRELPAPLAERVRARGHALSRLGRDDRDDRDDAGGPGDTRDRTAARAPRSSADGPPHAHWLGVDPASDARDTLAGLAAEAPVDWLVVDHYALDGRWERAVRAGARHLLAIDDLADRPHDCDLLLDQNLQPHGHARYDALLPANCERLLGPRYALLRPEFAHARGQVRTRGGPVARILVAFGGVDATDLTGQVLRALARIAPELAVDVVIGAAHPAHAALQAACEQHPGWRLHVQTDAMAALMAAADLAVGACGVITWERAALGLPALAFALAENQLPVLREAARAGLVSAPLESVVSRLEPAWLERHLLALIENAPLRELMSRAGLATVDGLGTERVAARICAPAVNLRPASLEDTDAMLAWRNAPEVRATARDAAPIDAGTHRRWLEATLANPRRVLLIGMHADEPIGVVRYDVLEGAGSAEVSIYLAPGRHGQGLGSALLAAGEQWMRNHHPEVGMLLAEVLEHNTASHRLFLAGGFEPGLRRYRKNLGSGG